MFRAKTVLILGAGASAEVGLPIGTGLLQQIVDLTHITYEYTRMVSGDHLIAEALRIHIDEGRELEKYNQHLIAARQLGNSAKQALSIDNVIDALEDGKVELIGKLGISRAILKSESESPFFKNRKDHQDEIELDNFKGTWYSYFSKILTENVKKSQISDIFNNIKIINFNYDRCLEHYLPYSIGNYYGIPYDEIRRLVKNLVVLRPYGSTGRLPWQDGDLPIINFGRGSSEQISGASQYIRTFTERIEDENAMKAIRSCISEADRIIFLGFSFHRQNVNLIGSPTQSGIDFLATVSGISASDRHVISKEISRSFCHYDGSYVASQRIKLADNTCAELFRDYWRTITAEPEDS